MSYFEALSRARQALSQARPRALSRYEGPNAAWALDPGAETNLETREAVTPGLSLRPAVEKDDEPAAAPAPLSTAALLLPAASVAPHAPVPSAPIAAAPLRDPDKPPPETVPALPFQARPPPTPPSPSAAQTAASARLPQPEPTLPSPVAVAAPADQRDARNTRPAREHRTEARPLPPPPKPQTLPAPPPQPDTSALLPAAAPATASGQAAAAPPPIIIEIGQIDIRLEAPARAIAASAQQRRPVTPTLSLDDYLRGRS